MNIGLFLSKGDGVISKAINLESIASQYSDLSSVKIYENILSSSAQKSIIEEIEKNNLQGVVLAGESPFYYRRVRNGDLFLRLIQKKGINKNKIGFANLREQVALPHRSEPENATKKAKVLVDIALQKVRMLKDVDAIAVTPKKNVAIIGTNTSGLFTAQKLLEMGYQIYFIDKSPFVNIEEHKDKITPTIAYLKNHPKVKFYLSGINDFYGYPGNFRITLKDGQKLRAGALVVAIQKDLDYTKELYPFLRIERDDDGFFKNITSDTATVETVHEGILLIPSNKDNSLSTIVSLADSAATSIESLLGYGDIGYELFVSQVDEEVCGGCGTCIKTCIFHAAELDAIKKLSSTNIKRCVGCGNCVSACPTGARDQVSATTAYLISAIKILSQYQPPNNIKILYLACEGCGYPSLDYAGRMGIEYPTSVLPLMVRCAGRIDTQLILEAFREGFHGVVVCKCKDDHCINIVGNTDLDRRANLFRTVLRSRGIEPERLRIFGVTECEGASCVEGAMEFISYLKSIGGRV